MKLYALGYMVVFVLVGCSDGKFSSFTNRRGSHQAEEQKTQSQPNDSSDSTPESTDDGGSLNEKTQDITLTCDGADNPTHPIVDVKSAANEKVVTRLKGEFCPANSSYLRVVFVVDFSASMAKHDIPASNTIGAPGHDPVVNGTCGRYEAIRVVVEKLTTLSVGKGDIDVGMIPFANGIVTPYMVEPVPLATFADQYTNVNQICRFVLQKADTYNTEPGAIPPTPAYSSGTSFEAPLIKAREYFAAKSVPGLMYFITDGEPTDAGSGMAAAQELAKQPNLTANSLLLSHDAANARSVLEALTPGAGAARVKDVAQASQLKDVIDQFKAPEINLKSGDAVLKIAAMADQTLGLIPYSSGDLFEKAGDVYHYEVKPFVLTGKAGEMTANIVEVQATGTDGRAYQARVEIRYSVDP